jgi:Xaa-Pro aminopeptidase
MTEPLPRPSATDDDALAALLARAGSALDAEALRALVAGVAAAPPGEEPRAWMALVAPEPPAELVAALAALEAEARAALAPAAAGAGAARLAGVRAELARRGLDGFVVPRADEHQGEYVPLCAERLAWLTGFTGSAGTAVVLAETAAVFVDGRYTLQAAQEVDAGAFAVVHSADQSAGDWIAKTAPAGARIGYDPRLHPRAGVERLAKACARAGAEAAPAVPNPLDEIWRGRPPPPVAPVVAHDARFAGAGAAEKRTRIADALAEDGIDAAVLTAPESIAWLLNLRGGDVPYTPLPLSFAILGKDGGVALFIDARKLTPGLDRHLGNGVEVKPPESFGPALAALGEAKRKVRADPATASAWVFDRLASGGAVIDEGPDPCALPKARKNPTELAGMRAAHLRDGAALCRFLHWLAETAPGGGVSELDAAQRLEDLRREGAHFRGLSFPTISGAGPDGAIVHYRVSAASNRALEPESLYLVDSGAQYLDGTTDVTRTVAIGAPTDEMRERFTRVLKGHIALATARFPRGTGGSQLDTFARQALWQAGLDYDHGTGHGVGHYLGGQVALEPGMIVSNEPGYYRQGAYGIRIENLVVVAETGTPEGGERELLGFETLTRAPIDRALIAPELLTPAEIAWLDAYHAEVRDSVGPLLDADAVRWLAEACAPIAPEAARA